MFAQMKNCPLICFVTIKTFKVKPKEVSSKHTQLFYRLITLSAARDENYVQPWQK